MMIISAISLLVCDQITFSVDEIFKNFFLLSKPDAGQSSKQENLFARIAKASASLHSGTAVMAPFPMFSGIIRRSPSAYRMRLSDTRGRHKKSGPHLLA